MVLFCSRHKRLCDELWERREMLLNAERRGCMHVVIVKVFAEPDARLLSIHLLPWAVTPGLGFEFHFNCHARHSQPQAHPCALHRGTWGSSQEFALERTLVKQCYSVLMAAPHGLRLDDFIPLSCPSAQSACCTSFTLPLRPWAAVAFKILLYWLKNVCQWYL